ncbi:MAG TPA: hypothetical protein VK507_21535 [Iamia sp.]|nr:hypothetical protein [Iamia sp.]
MIIGLVFLVGACVYSMATDDDDSDFDRNVDCEMRRNFVEDEYGTETPDNFC